MNRRTLLALCGAVVPLAGCLGDDDSPSSGTDPTRTETATTAERSTPAGGETAVTVAESATVGGGSATLETVATTESFVHFTTPDSKGVSAAQQYVFGQVALDGVSPTEDGFVLDVGSTSTTPSGRYAYRDTLVDGESITSYRADEGGGWLLFEVPESLDADEGRLELSVDGETVAWTLPSAVLASLRRAPPSFDLRDFTVEPAASRSSATFAATVENTADVDGSFRAALNQSGPGYAPLATVEVPVGAGESVSVERTVSLFGEGGGEYRFTFDWPGGTEERVVDFDG